MTSIWLTGSHVGRGFQRVERDDPDPDAALVGLHRRYERPLVRFRVVHFDGAEVLHAVVPAYRPQPVHVGDEGDAASSNVHRRHQLPP